MVNDELYVKEQMAEKLNMLFAIDPSLALILLRTNFATHPRLSLTTIECHTPSVSRVWTNFLGILNGMYGTNKYSIVPVYDAEVLVGFKVDLLDQANLINVNPNQDIIEET